jgi:hypothetical protein
MAAEAPGALSGCLFTFSSVCLSFLQLRLHRQGSDLNCWHKYKQKQTARKGVRTFGQVFSFGFKLLY